MRGFAYRNGRLHADDVDLTEIAAVVGTPTYVYSASVLEQRYRAYTKAGDGQTLGVHFSLKANNNLAIVSFLNSLGAGADIVSVGEMKRALAAGIPAAKIIFSGIGKTRDELSAAVVAGVGQINVESVPELFALDAAARAAGRKQRITLRINPDVDAQTHEKISTGKRGDKFGIAYDEALAAYRQAVELPGLDVAGFSLHIGSHLSDLTPYRIAYGKMAALIRTVREVGLAVETLDLGGGIGVTYKDEIAPSLDDYMRIVLETVGNLGCSLAVEPGRSIVGPAGILLSRVTYRKASRPNDILILDAGMNDLVRPAMYNAYHPITPVTQPAADMALSPVDVVGPICETGDTFARERLLPTIAAEDLVAFGVAGAYGSSMASNYNARPLPAEVMVHGGRFDIIRPRQLIEATYADERVPDWIAGQDKSSIG
jgi:diaminopimelate decarboxylase